MPKLAAVAFTDLFQFKFGLSTQSRDNRLIRLLSIRLRHSQPLDTNLAFVFSRIRQNSDALGILTNSATTAFNECLGRDYRKTSRNRLE